MAEVELWRYDCGHGRDGKPCWHYHNADPGPKVKGPVEKLVAFPDAEGRALARCAEDVRAAMGLDDGNVPRLLGRIMRAVAGVQDARDGGDRQYVIDQSFQHEDYAGKEGYAPLVPEDRIVEAAKAAHGMGRVAS